MLRGLQALPASRRSIPTLYPAGQRVFRAQRCKTLSGDYLARQVGFEESENYVYYELGGALPPHKHPFVNSFGTVSARGAARPDARASISSPRPTTPWPRDR